MERYNCTYKGVDGSTFEISISNPTYSGSSSSITGYAEYSMVNVSSARDPIRSKELKLELLATPAEDLSDLMEQDDDRYWEVTYSKDGTVLFFGYITSENAIRPFVIEETYISLSALDPLAFLENLSYVDNLTGIPFTGSEQVAKIISNCLKRCFASGSTPFNIEVHVPYDYRMISPITGVETDFSTGRILKDTTLGQSQYIDDDGQIESCLNVLSQTLSGLNLCITQMKGNTWVIYHYLHDMETLPSLYVNTYDSNGDDLVTTPLLPFSTELVHNDTPSYTSGLLHAGNRQQYHSLRGTQLLSAKYAFIGKDNNLENANFEGGVNGVSMPGWISGTDYAEATDQGYLKINKYDAGVNTDDYASEYTGSPVVVTERNVVKVVGSFFSTFAEPIFYFNIRLDSPDHVNPFYLGFFGDSIPYWFNTSQRPTANHPFAIGLENDVVDFEYELRQIPAFGEITIEVFATRNIGAQTLADSTTYLELRYLDVIGGNLNTSGVIYENTANTTSLKAETTDIFIDTDKFNINANQLIKLSINNPINLVRDVLSPFTYQRLGTFTSWNYMQLNRRRKIFSGEIYGFVDCHKYISIPEISSNYFVCLEYIYDSRKNTTFIKAEEIRNQQDAFNQQILPQYIDAIEPTIKS